MLTNQPMDFQFSSIDDYEGIGEDSAIMWILLQKPEEKTGFFDL